MRNRILVLHGVNLDQLERRPAHHYGDLTLQRLEMQIERFGRELGFDVSFVQSNHEGEYVEELHKAPDLSDGLVLNPGAWTHYSWAIRDALELAALPAVEVHLSDLAAREEWRQLSVISDLCVGRVMGKGVEGYRDALELLREALK